MKLRLNPAPFRYTLGERGETLAWHYLKEQGYRILEKNYRCPIGEIDVIARKNGRLLFIEVKTRQSHDFGRPEEAVGFHKQKKLMDLAACYVKEKNLKNTSLGFEVAAITWESGREPEIRVIPQAFEAGDERWAF